MTKSRCREERKTVRVTESWQMNGLVPHIWDPKLKVAPRVLMREVSAMNSEKWSTSSWKLGVNDPTVFPVTWLTLIPNWFILSIFSPCKKPLPTPCSMSFYTHRYTLTLKIRIIFIFFKIQSNKNYTFHIL